MRRVLLLLVIIAFAGCQPVTVKRNEDGPVPVSVRVDDAAYWLEEWYRVRQLSEDQLVQTLKTREQEFEHSGDTRARLRLALLLAEGPATVRDQDRALVLLNSMDGGSFSDSARALAALLEQIIAEQRWASDRIKQLKDDLKRDGARIQELERQLQELTNIEQSIQQRETPGDRKEKE